MNALVQRARAWATVRRFAQLALLVQPLIVLRTAGEYLRLAAAGDPPAALVGPLFTALAGVGAVTMGSLVLFYGGRHRSVIALTIAAIAALVVYKMLAMPGLG